MCGIAGVKRMGNEPITAEEIALLACSLEHRGNHATGIAIENNGEVSVCKKDIPAWAFIASNQFKDFVKEHLRDDTNTVIVHTRAATKGSPWKNENNHPMFAGQVAVVHNGCIHNDDTIFQSLQLKRSCETDSDIIRAILDKEGFTHKGIRDLDRLSGSMAIAAINTEAPNYVLLARSGSPLVIGATEFKMYWASEQQAIQKAGRQWHQRFGIWLKAPSAGHIEYNTMPDDTAWLIGPNGIEWHQNVQTCTNYIAPNYRMHETYWSKTSNWRAEKRRAAGTSTDKPKHFSSVTIETEWAATCPHCKSGVTKRNARKPWRKYNCPKCYKSLASLDDRV